MTAEHVTCFHCGLPCSSEQTFTISILQKKRDMCCPGCLAVAQAIVDNDLVEYYQYRTEKSVTATNLVPDELEQLNLYDNNKLQDQFVIASNSADNIKSASLILEGIVCAACVWLSEKHISQIDGVDSFSVNYSTQRANVSWDDSKVKLSDILKSIASIGYRAHPFDASKQESIQKKQRQKALIRLAVAGLGAMQVMMFAIALYAGEANGIDADMKQFFQWVSALIATPVVFYSAQTFFIGAWKDLKRRQLGMDVPVALAIGTAYSASVWATISGTGQVYFDSVTMFTFFLLVGRFLELRARQRSSEVADSLVKLLPVMATKILDNKTEQVLVNSLTEGDLVLVKPGEIIPADGVISKGKSRIDESLVTGESYPLHREENENVIGGTVNIESPLTVQVTQTGDKTVLAGIQRLLDRAQSEKPSIAILADKVASYFVAAILIIAAVVGYIWWQIDSDRAAWIVLSMLVVTCPCALSLATPAAMTAATGALTRLGLLVTHAHALETLSKVDTFVFDKTGTLTQGRLAIKETILLGPIKEDVCLSIAASMESVSEHPIAKAFSHYNNEDVSIAETSAVVGQGIEALIDGLRYRIGKQSWVNEITSDEIILDKAQTESSSLSSVIYLANEEKGLAIFILEDTLRDESKHVITLLHELNINTILLSGDQNSVVENTANQLNIKQRYSEQSPDNKLSVIKTLQNNKHVVAMVGDGVNDAPVLAAAQVSIAMGKGTELAQASSDMVLLSENLTHIVESILHARKTFLIVKQNLSWAILYNIAALPLAALGFIAPWLAAIGMSASSLIVVINALRLKTISMVNTLD